jgi:hypothetical protein
VEIIRRTHLAQRRHQARIEIDVRCAAAERLSVDGGGRQIDAGVDAATGRENLEPQKVLVGCDDGVRHALRQYRLVNKEPGPH